MSRAHSGTGGSTAALWERSPQASRKDASCWQVASWPGVPGAGHTSLHLFLDTLGCLQEPGVSGCYTAETDRLQAVATVTARDTGPELEKGAGLPLKKSP